ncbi:hypothetical protein [Thiohalocapsa marina]|uniref:hypothetical protein n=1 Tax=Thiohalocapsa marina TaxID=424902 RepID=UPI0036DB4930
MTTQLHPAETTDRPPVPIVDTDPDALLSSATARRLAGGISVMTEWRWRRDGLLPAPVQIRGRNYYRRGPFMAALRHLGDAA